MRTLQRVALALLFWFGLTGETFFACRTGSGDPILTLDRNSAPVAQDGVTSTTVNVAVSGTLVASDRDGDDLTYTITTGPTLGTVQLVNASTGDYTYLSSEAGGDSFSYRASDGKAESNTATISVTVLASQMSWQAVATESSTDDSMCAADDRQSASNIAAADPFDSNHLLAVTSGTGLRESVDGGLTWKSVTPAAVVGEVVALAFSSDVPGLYYMVSRREAGARIIRHDYGVGWQVAADTRFEIEKLDVLETDATGRTTVRACTKDGGSVQLGQHRRF